MTITSIADHVDEARKDLEEGVDRAERPTSVSVVQEDLPEPLQSRLDDFDEALNRTPPPEKFPESASYPTAPDVAAIARLLIEAFHPHLEDETIVYVYRENLTRAGEVTHGKVTQASGRYRERFGVDWFVDINWTSWVGMRAAARIRLVDHELSHLVEESTADGSPKIVSRRHDVEEFVEIIRRWGIEEGTRQEELARTINQLELFAPA